MAQQDIKQIRGASQGSILFLGTNSIVSEDYDNLNWDQGTFSINHLMYCFSYFFHHCNFIT